jgi:hypothetical protein
MNMLTTDEQCKEITMNPKAQVVFLHLQLLTPFLNTCYMWKQKHSYEDNNIGVLCHIKVYYGCYKIRKNGSLCIHTNLLWLKDTSNPNTFMQTLHHDEKIQEWNHYKKHWSMLIMSKNYFDKLPWWRFWSNMSMHVHHKTLKYRWQRCSWTIPYW